MDSALNPAPLPLPELVRSNSWPKPSGGEVTVRTVHPLHPQFSSETDLPAATECELHIYNVAGRLVATVESPNGSWEGGSSDAGFELLWHWDGRDAGDFRAPKGMYLAQLVHGGQTIGAEAKILLLR